MYVSRRTRLTARAQVTRAAWRTLDPEQQHRKKHHRVDCGVREPAERSIEPKRDASRDGRNRQEAQSTEESVGRDTGDELQQNVLVELPLLKTVSSVGGKNAAACRPPASGTPVPSYGFHQGS